MDVETDIIAGKSTVILKSKDNSAYKVILGILNSKLISFYIKESFGALGIDGGINFTADLVENLPFPKLDGENVKDIKNFIDKILAITKSDDYLQNEGKQKKVKEYEQKIDKMVYKFYGLTLEETKIIEQ